MPLTLSRRAPPWTRLPQALGGLRISDRGTVATPPCKASSTRTSEDSATGGRTEVTRTSSALRPIPAISDAALPRSRDWARLALQGPPDSRRERVHGELARSLPPPQVPLKRRINS